MTFWSIDFKSLVSDSWQGKDGTEFTTADGKTFRVYRTIEAALSDRRI
jgi:hypothetical protein